ncbi:hypothetical protein FO520_24060, partial [Bacillus subtilis]
LKTKKRYLALALASVVALAGCDNSEDTAKKESAVSAPVTTENTTKTAPVAEQKKSAPKLSNEEMVKKYAGKD